MNKILIALLIGILVGGCLQSAPQTHTKEKAVETAKEFLANSPTYKWDGENMKVIEVRALYCPYCWSVAIEFQSRHGGYGDRTGKIVTQVINPHTARIVVKEGKVISAVLDEKWDEMIQDMLVLGEPVGIISVVNISYLSYNLTGRTVQLEGIIKNGEEINKCKDYLYLAEDTGAVQIRNISNKYVDKRIVVKGKYVVPVCLAICVCDPHIYVEELIKP